MIRFMIVEDQRIIRGLLESYVAQMEGYQLAASVSSATQAAELCETEHFDLILMDVQTEHCENGLSVVGRIRKNLDAVKIIVVTSLLDAEVLRQAKQCGADSLWYKDCDGKELTDIIRRTMAGEHIFPDTPPVCEVGTAKSTDFTRGEMKVLRCLVRGMSYSATAQALGIEPTTVKYHVVNMLQKTNLENKLRLALAASNAKLVAELEE